MDKILDDSVQARYFVCGQVAISRDRFRVDWVSLTLRNDKNEQDKETSNKRRGKNGGRIKRNKKS